MNSQLYNRIKSVVYIVTFIISVVIRWTYFGDDGPFAFTVINQIIYIPMLFMIGLMYFHYRYYHNTFIQTRYSSLQEVRRHHFQSNILESLEFLVWQLIIAIILGFHIFTLESFYSLAVIIVTLLLMYMAYTLIYTTILEITKQYYYAFVTCGILLIAYRIIVLTSLHLGSYALTYDGLDGNYILIIAYLFVIVGCIVVNQFYFQQNRKIRIDKKIMMLVSYIFIEIVSELFLRNQSLVDTSLSLNNYFGFMQSNELFITLLWMIPKMMLLYIGFMMFCERYRLNYTFYAVRIKSKRKWVYKIMKEIYLFIMIVVCSKLIFHCLFYQVFDLSLLLVSCQYFLYIVALLSLLIVGYIITRSESIFNSMTIVYVIVVTFVGIMRISPLQFLLLDDSFITTLCYLCFIFVIYNIIVYLMNHHEYY